jgi:serine/threonine protein kinase/tetratricopeptide (TPR) repeat protein
MVTACLDEQTLQRFVEGTLNVTEANAVEAHLDICEECRATLADWARAEPTLQERSGDRDAPRWPGGVLVAGMTVGRYVVLHRVGMGAMGVVYQAFDPQLDRRVALKVLNAEFSDRGYAASARARLVREARIMARLSHPNVVAIYDVLSAGEQLAIAMEYVDGVTLRRWLHQQSRSLQAIVAKFVMAARGLAAAHRTGVVHRDFKPDNVLIGKDGRVHVTDFGLARIGSRTVGPPPDPCVQGPTEFNFAATSLSNSLGLAGTPAYMAPELLAGGPATDRSDQFSFCVALYEALCGVRPLTAVGVDTDPGKTGIPPRPKLASGRLMPGRLHTVLQRGLSPEPEDRHFSMDAFLLELEALSQRTKRHVVALVLAAALMPSLALGFWHMGKSQSLPCRNGRQLVEEAWNPTLRAQLRSRLQETKSPEYETAAANVATRLDQYTEGWLIHFTETCEATHVYGSQSVEAFNLKMRCLKHLLQRVEGLTSSVQTADPSALLRVREAVWRLPSISLCDDTTALENQGLALLSPEQRRRVERLQGHLTRIETLELSGRYEQGVYEQGLEELAPIIDRAQDLGVPLITAQAARLRGFLLARLGRYAEGAEEGEKAFNVAMAHGDDQMAAQSASLLCSLVGYAMRSHGEGIVWGKIALALSERGRHNQRQRAVALNRLGAVYRRNSEPERAERLHRQARQLQKEVWPKEHHPEQADSLHELGFAVFAQGRVTEAQTLWRQALGIRQSTLGRHHSATGESLIALGDVLREQGRFDDSQKNNREALQIFKEALGDKHPFVAMAHHALGATARRRGQADVAIQHLQISIEKQEHTIGHFSPYTAFSEAELALAFMLDGQPKKAYDAAIQAAEICERRPCEGRLHTMVLWTLSQASMRLGRPSQAILLANRALQLASSLPPIVAKEPTAEIEAWLQSEDLEQLRRRKKASSPDVPATCVPWRFGLRSKPAITRPGVECRGLIRATPRQGLRP